MSLARHIRGVYGVVKLKGETALARPLASSYSYLVGMRAIGREASAADFSQRERAGDEIRKEDRASHQLFLTWPVGKIKLVCQVAFLPSSNPLLPL